MCIRDRVTEIASGKKKGCDRKLGGLIRRMKHGDTLIVTEISRLSRTLTDLMAIKMCIRDSTRPHDDEKQPYGGQCKRLGISLY